jgi:enediyne biosynthesis protein E4
MLSVTRRLVTAAVALILCIGAGYLTARPGLSEAQSAAVASRFHFDTVALNTAPPNARTQRQVEPSLENIRSWISAVGAAVSLVDLRGLGRPADACLVDPRDDSVTVLPVPTAGGPDYPRFQLRPRGLPYDSTMAPMGCIPADFNEDGSMDFLVYYWGRSPVLFINYAPPGTLPSADQFRPVELVSPMQTWNTSAANVGDIDGDGHLDILIGNYFPDGARVLDPSATADGRMAMQDGMGLARNAGVNRLLLLHPTGQKGSTPGVTDASDAFPADSAKSWTLAFGLQDLTGDLLPEIYVANDFGPDQLLVNKSRPGHVELVEVNGERDLVTPRSEALGHDSFKGMGVTFTYSDGNKLPMIFVSNITSRFALQESNFAFIPTGDGSELLTGHLPYHERSEELGLSRSGWSWDVKSGDFDNDGRDELIQAAGFVQGEHNRWPELQELAMGNDGLLRFPSAWPNFRAGDDLSGHQHDLFWVRTGDRYSDLATRIGLGQPYVTRGLAIGDVDGDDALDVLVANQWQDSVLLRNTTPTPGKAADLRLLLPAGGGATRAAIGARVEVTGPTGQYTTQLYPANGHAGVSADEVHLPLPQSGTAQATITWRTGTEIHSASVEVRPGHHAILLTSDGTAIPK